MSEPQVPKTPEQLSKEAADRIELAMKAAQAIDPKPAPSAPSKAVATQVASALSVDDLEEAIRRVLNQAKAPAKLVEPNWAELTEEEAFSENPPYIPVIEHEIPSYMNVELADPEYVCVWASKDQRRLGQLEAEGYEYIKPEHMRKGFKIPLKFTSEGLYAYHDVIAMRVHKKIRFGKLKRYQQISQNQLRPLMMQQKAVQDLNKGVIENDPELGRAFATGGMSFTQPEI
jgi:hypothetical protein